MGPLAGIRIIELEAIGPVPFCGMLLGDLGADVIRIDRVGGPQDPLRTLLSRSRRSVGLNLKHDEGREAALRIVEGADVLLEGMRPGVTERLGLGPDVCLARNPRLVYGRMTGWGQDGPLAARAGHDIDYIAVTGALHAVGSADAPPPPPLNLFGDFGGGSLYLAMGVLAALNERTVSGKGQVVDAAMVDGAASLMTMVYEMQSRGMWIDAREANLLDGAAPWYRTYPTSDDRYVAVGAIEPQFYAELLDRLGLDAAALPHQHDRTSWDDMHRRFGEVFGSQTRDHWADVFAGSDACVAPVVSLREAPDHPHLAARGTFVDTVDGAMPAPAPRFSRSIPDPPTPPAQPGEHTDHILTEAGFELAEIARLRQIGAAG
jgi:alpha-methylacyl-CoA racemase